jgi:hypothetical protein
MKRPEGSTIIYKGTPAVFFYNEIKASLICCGYNYVLSEILTVHLLFILFINYLSIKNAIIFSVIQLK